MLRLLGPFCFLASQVWQSLQRVSASKAFALGTVGVGLALITVPSFSVVQPSEPPAVAAQSSGQTQIVLPLLARSGTGGTAVSPISGTAPAPPPPSATPQVAMGLYRPEFPNDLRAVSGRIRIIHWFSYWGGWKREFNRNDLELVRARGEIPMISWEPWAGTPNDPAWTLRGAILSGKNDAYIESWARGLADYGRPVLFRFAHEMHHQTYPWTIGVNGNTAEEYVAAWRHVHNIFRRYNTANVRWVWTPNTLGDSRAETYLPIYQSLYPGGEYVDWIGLDIYNTGPTINWGAPYCRSFSQVMSEPYQAITSLDSKPLILPEVGTAESCGNKAAWITSALNTELPAQFPLTRGVIWFDVNKEERWSVHASPEALQAWIDAAERASGPTKELPE